LCGSAQPRAIPWTEKIVTPTHCGLPDSVAIRGRNCPFGKHLPGWKVDVILDGMAETAEPQDLPDARAAADALDRAARVAHAAHAQGWRWVRIYLTGWAIGSVGLILLIGLGGAVGMVVGVAAWAVLVTVGVLWARGQGAVVAATKFRLGIGSGLWSAAYVAILALGVAIRPGAAYWVPAALVSTVPLLLAGWLPARRPHPVS
jgi:hypothetical protein